MNTLVALAVATVAVGIPSANADAARDATHCKGHVVRVAYGDTPDCDLRSNQILVVTFPTFDGYEHAKVEAICEDAGGFPVRINHKTATAECRVDH